VLSTGLNGFADKKANMGFIIRQSDRGMFKNTAGEE
jgi:hypothetical protein